MFLHKGSSEIKCLLQHQMAVFFVSSYIYSLYVLFFIRVISFF